jgi:hypothetical protein
MFWNLLFQFSVYLFYFISATGWNTIGTPGRSTERTSPARTSLGRPSPVRSVSGSQQLSPQPNETPQFKVSFMTYSNFAVFVVQLHVIIIEKIQFYSNRSEYFLKN